MQKIVFTTALLVVFSAACFSPETDGVRFSFPQSLRLQHLSSEQQKLLRASIEMEGLPGGENKLKIERSGSGYIATGRFTLDIDKKTSTEMTIRLYGRHSASSAQVLLARRVEKVEIEPGVDNKPELKNAFVSSGEPIFDLNRNGLSNLQDLLSDPSIDPTPPPAFLSAPVELRFFSGIELGEFERQVILLQNVSAHNLSLTAELFDAPGVLLDMVDRSGSALREGAKRKLGEDEPLNVAPHSGTFIAVSFAPMNDFLTWGALQITASNTVTHVVQTTQVRIIANSSGNLQPAPFDYDPAALAGTATLGGYPVAEVRAFPGDELFSGLPISSDATQQSGQLLYATGRTLGLGDGASLTADAVYLVEIPAGHRFSATLNDLTSDVDLALLPLDSEDSIATDATPLLSQTVAANPEAVSTRAPSDQALRALLVLGRHQQSKDGASPNALTAALDADEGVPFSLAAHVVSGPEFDESQPITPNVGALNGGILVTLRGTGFQQGARVYFAYVEAIDAEVNSDGTTIECTLPPGSLEVGKNPATVVVANPPVGEGGDGQAVTLPEGFTYRPPAPVISELRPGRGPVGGETPITIVGSFFSTRFGGPKITFEFSDNSTAELFGEQIQFISPSELSVEAPAAPQAGPAQIRVVNYVSDDRDEERSEAAAYSYEQPQGPAPTIDSVAVGQSGQPASGTVDGGTTVTIEGTHFVAGATVTFDRTSALSVTFVNTTTLRAQTPPHSVGDVDVVVVNPDGQRALAALAFSYEIPAPAVQSIFPNRFSTNGGDTLAVDGSGFRSGVLALFHGGVTPIPAVSTTRLSDSRLLVITPILTAGDYGLEVRNVDGQTDTYSSIAAVAPTGPAPRILQLSPDRGPLSGGYAVTVIGDNFDVDPVADVLVGVASAPLAGVTAVSSNQLSFTMPASSEVGQVTLRVLNRDGQSDSTTFLYQTEISPVITALVPDVVHGMVPGDTLLVLGNHLDASPVSSAAVTGAGGPFAATVLSAANGSVRLQVAEALPVDTPLGVSLLFESGDTVAAVGLLQAKAPTITGLGSQWGPLAPYRALYLEAQGEWLNPDHLIGFAVSGSAYHVSGTLLHKSENLVRFSLPSPGLSPGEHYGLYLLYDNGFSYMWPDPIYVEELRIDKVDPGVLPADCSIDRLFLEVYGDHLGELAMTQNASVEITSELGVIVPSGDVEVLQLQPSSDVMALHVRLSGLLPGDYGVRITDQLTGRVVETQGWPVQAVQPAIHAVFPAEADAGSQLIVLGEHLGLCHHSHTPYADDGQGTTQNLNHRWLGEDRAIVYLDTLPTGNWDICIPTAAPFDCSQSESGRVTVLHEETSFFDCGRNDPQCMVGFECHQAPHGSLCSAGPPCDSDLEYALDCGGRGSSCVMPQSFGGEMAFCVPSDQPCSQVERDLMDCDPQICAKTANGIPFCGDPCDTGPCPAEQTCVGVGAQALCVDTLPAPRLCTSQEESTLGSCGGGSYCIVAPPGNTPACAQDCNSTTCPGTDGCLEVSGVLVCLPEGTKECGNGMMTVENGDGDSYCIPPVTCDGQSDGVVCDMQRVCSNSSCVEAPQMPLPYPSTGFPVAVPSGGSSQFTVTIENMAMADLTVENATIFGLPSNPQPTTFTGIGWPVFPQVLSYGALVLDVEAFDGTIGVQPGIMIVDADAPMVPRIGIKLTGEISGSTDPTCFLPDDANNVAMPADLYEHEGESQGDICPEDDVDYYRFTVWTMNGAQLLVWGGDAFIEAEVDCDEVGGSWPPGGAAFSSSQTATDPSPLVFDIPAQYADQECLLTVRSSSPLSKTDYKMELHSNPYIDRIVPDRLPALGQFVLQSVDIYGSGFRTGDILYFAASGVMLHDVAVVSSTHIQAKIGAPCGAEHNAPDSVHVARGYGTSRSEDGQVLGFSPPNLVILEVVVNPFSDYSCNPPPNGFGSGTGCSGPAADDIYVTIKNPSECTLDISGVYPGRELYLHAVEPNGPLLNSPQPILVTPPMWSATPRAGCTLASFGATCEVVVSDLLAGQTPHTLSPFTHVALYESLFSGVDLLLHDSISLGSSGVPDGAQFTTGSLTYDAVRRCPSSAIDENFYTPYFARGQGEPLGGTDNACGM